MHSPKTRDFIKTKEIGGCLSNPLFRLFCSLLPSAGCLMGTWNTFVVMHNFVFGSRDWKLRLQCLIDAFSTNPRWQVIECEQVSNDTRSVTHFGIRSALWSGYSALYIRASSSELLAWVNTTVVSSHMWWWRGALNCWKASRWDSFESQWTTRAKGLPMK